MALLTNRHGAGMSVGISRLPDYRLDNRGKCRLLPAGAPIPTMVPYRVYRSMGTAGSFPRGRVAKSEADHFISYVSK
jgi:hypothetical protein